MCNKNVTVLLFLRQRNDIIFFIRAQQIVYRFRL